MAKSWSTSALLWALASGESYPVELRERVKKDGRALSLGTIHPALHHLEEEGLVESEKREKDKRRYYRLTEEGKKALAEVGPRRIALSYWHSRYAGGALAKQTNLLGFLQVYIPSRFKLRGAELFALIPPDVRFIECYLQDEEEENWEAAVWGDSEHQVVDHHKRPGPGFQRLLVNGGEVWRKEG